MTSFANGSIPIAIIGGTGYGAGEALRMLTNHPHFEVVSISSRSHAGIPVSHVHSHLAGMTALHFEAEINFDHLSSAERSAIIVAVPHGQSVLIIERLLANPKLERTVIVDMSGDLRLKVQAIHERFYPDVPVSPSLRSTFVYGLPEISRVTISGATRISNPGCLATASILALSPVVRDGLCSSIVIDAKTGTSGAGREPQPTMHHPSRCADFTAYKALEHRHEPEILQALGDPLGSRLSIVFVPHLIPVSRGIFVTCYMRLDTDLSAQEIVRRYSDFYEGSPFIRIKDRPPRLTDVVGTNFCDLFVAVRGRDLVVMTALDNLGKGMAGQAIQNLNLAFGLPEDAGLKLSAIGPV